MKTIIAGSRNILDYNIVEEAITLSKFNITEVVSGTARGVDLLGEKYANNYNLPIKQFKPNWTPNGILDRGAGHKRNIKMGNYADALIAIWDGKSKGTKQMIDYATSKGLKVFVHTVSQKIINVVED